jgi:TolA-binding protein
MRHRLNVAFALLILTSASAGVVCAQDPAPTPAAPACTEELFERTQHAFRIRKIGSEELHAAETELKEVVLLCSEPPAADQAATELKVVEEELAEHNLQIALFYKGRPARSGALSRLRLIVERYPHYSKMDQVLWLLGELDVEDDNLDEAATSCERLIREFPGSSHVGDATLRLAAIEVIRSEKSPLPIP